MGHCHNAESALWPTFKAENRGGCLKLSEKHLKDITEDQVAFWGEDSRCNIDASLWRK
jgi:hypothetical protein